MRLERVEKGTTRMQKTDVRYQAFVTILNEQLRPAMGCTEPIAIAYEDTSSADTTLACFRGYVGKIANTPAMKQAYEIGKTV